MNNNISYSESHKKPGKGLSYEASFETQKYRKMIWQLEKFYLKKILEENFNNEKIIHLDFACGTGRILKFLEDKTEISIGIDISNEMIKVAKNNVKSEIIEGDITKENLLKDKKFNLVTAFRFFPNAEENLRVGMLDNIVPHITNNGYLVFNNHRNKDSFLEKCIRLIFRKKYRGMNMKEVKLMVKKYDLELLRVYSMGFFRDCFKRNLPFGLIQKFEILFGQFLKLNNYGYNQIYVFRKNLRR